MRILKNLEESYRFLKDLKGDKGIYKIPKESSRPSRIFKNQIFWENPKDSVRKIAIQGFKMMKHATGSIEGKKRKKTLESHLGPSGCRHSVRNNLNPERGTMSWEDEICTSKAVARNPPFTHWRLRGVKHQSLVNH